MIRFIPSQDSFSGRWLARLGRTLGLRSETVYSRAILLTTLVFFLLGTLAVCGVWYFMFRHFNAADAQEARTSATAVRDYLTSHTPLGAATPAPAQLKELSALLGRDVFFRETAPGASPSDGESINVQKLPGGLAQATFAFGAGEVVISGQRPYYETGTQVARVVLVGLAAAAGVTLLLILFIVDRTILTRIQLLASRVEQEKNAERLPVKLDFGGEDELTQLARSIEDLAHLVQDTEREYRDVVEDQIESICRFDAAERITFSNRAFEVLCVKPPKERHDLLSSCLAAPTLQFLRRGLDNLSPASPVCSLTHRVAGKNHKPLWYRSTLRANFDAYGRRTGGQWIASDVTSEVQAQRKLQDSQQELQALSARLMNLQDEERRRIARELHDSTAQSLSALEMNMSFLISLCTDDHIRKLAAETAGISRQVCRELRNLSYLLHPPLLEERGLLFAIRWFADGFTKRNGIPVFLNLPDNFPRLDEDMETALFRIVQEALSNIYRHAGATKAWIALHQKPGDDLMLEIRDNGEGLPEGFTMAQSSGVGLAGMRERMKHLGGSLEVASSPYGVSVQCRIQLNEKVTHTPNTPV